MISLKIIGDEPVTSNLFLNGSGVPIIIIAIICLFIAYIKIKKSNRNKDWNIELTDSKDNMDIDSRDILMQPKKSVNGIQNENKIPFTNFSLENIYFGLGVLLVLISIAYVLISEARYS